MRKHRTVIIQIGLFIATFITTTFAGSYWTSGNFNFVEGLPFSIPFLLFLTAHEFGHYFMAMYHKVRVSLPYFIPFPILTGTLGAVIIKERAASKSKEFDIGIAGPIAGFVIGFLTLCYGFSTLPPAEHIFKIHPEYQKHGLDYAQHVYNKNDSIVDISIGKNILFTILEKTIADPARVPNPHEIMHYPYLFAGYLALVFTFLNLLPIGQLDGGHILYGLAGHKKHRIIASIFFIGFMFYAGLGNEYIALDKPFEDLLVYVILYGAFLYFAFTGLKFEMKDTMMVTVLVLVVQVLLSYYLPSVHGYSGWLVFGFVIGRFIGITHPGSEIEEPLDSKRIILGWVAVLIFVLCFSPNPLE